MPVPNEMESYARIPLDWTRHLLNADGNPISAIDAFVYFWMEHHYVCCKMKSPSESCEIAFGYLKNGLNITHNTARASVTRLTALGLVQELRAATNRTGAIYRVRRYEAIKSEVKSNSLWEDPRMYLPEGGSTWMIACATINEVEETLAELFTYVKGEDFVGAAVSVFKSGQRYFTFEHDEKPIQIFISDEKVAEQERAKAEKDCPF